MDYTSDRNEQELGTCSNLLLTRNKTENNDALEEEGALGEEE